MHMSLNALREILRNCDPSELPSDLAECLAGNVAAIRANSAAGRAWEQQIHQKAMAASPDHPHQAAPVDPRPLADTSPPLHAATTDPSPAVLPIRSHQSPLHAVLPICSHHPRPDASQPSSHAPRSATVPAPSPIDATVHRTELRLSRGKRTLEDLALQVCTPHFFIDLGEDEHPWEPRDLFPEISTPPTHHISQSGPKTRKKASQNPKSKKIIPSLQPRRSNRIGKKKSGVGTVLDINVQNFVDVPLQHSEGTELLALIGADNTPIPSHIMLSSQHKTTDFETGQPSKGPTKKNKHSGPTTHSSMLPIQGPMSIVQAHSTSHSDNHLGQSAHRDPPPAAEAPAGSGFSPITNDPTDLDEQIEDPYLNRVDYSDEDPLF